MTDICSTIDVRSRTRAPARPSGAYDARPGDRRRPAAAPLRLTRRGRAVVLAVVLLAALGAFALRSDPAASTGVVHHPATTTVVVEPGETLWDIARRAEPGVDPRDAVADIETLNALPGDVMLRVGQPLLVPVR